MGKRIRHLEFYGYADQNVYMGLPNVDLSDIRETNKEQDKEINAISGATSGKADKATVDSLSGKVDTFMDKQDKINKWLAKGINKNRERIDKLESRDREITDKINEIVDDFNPIYDELGNLSSKVDSVDDKLNQHISQESTFEEETDARLDSLENKIDKKLDEREACHKFAKKCDVYTKQEVDDKIAHIGDGYATEEWVLSRGFITEVDADGKYASKARLNALEDRVGDIQTTLYNQYNELNSDLTQYKTLTNGRIDTLNTRVSTVEAKCDREIANVQEDIAELAEDVEKNSNDIYQINNVALPSKADKADLNSLESRVNNLSNNLNNKVDKTDYERDKARIGVQLDALDNKKADKTQISGITEEINDVASDLEQEIRDRIAGDNALGQRIDNANVRIDDIREENIERDEKLSNLRRDLSKEINDRVEADNAIIGSASDREEDNTIYGAKKYAKNVANNALNEAKAYTDTRDSSVRDYIDETKSDLERQITGKADKAYVNAIKGEIEASVEDKIATEKNRAETVESSLANEIRQETLRAVNKENIISNALAHTSNIVKAITDWDGDDRQDYTDVGNGILDVLHREFHEYVDEHGDNGQIKEITYEDGFLIIVYYTPEGEKRTEIPIADIVDLSDYYTKEETEAVIAEAIAHINLDNYYTKEETDAAIDSIVGNASQDFNTLGKIESKVNDNSSSILNLLVKLGYNGNDTLVKNHDSEVAFGKYNVSNTSDEPSGRTIFSIGNGTDSENRSNAIEVRENGDIYMWVEGDFMNVNKLLGQLAHEIYDTDSHVFDGG